MPPISVCDSPKPGLFARLLPEASGSLYRRQVGGTPAPDARDRRQGRKVSYSVVARQVLASSASMSVLGAQPRRSSVFLTRTSTCLTTAVTHGLCVEGTVSAHILSLSPSDASSPASWPKSTTTSIQLSTNRASSHLCPLIPPVGDHDLSGGEGPGSEARTRQIAMIRRSSIQANADGKTEGSDVVV